MKLAMKIDHVVVLVPDLAAAQAHWRSMGFTVTPGGVHADGLTHNALVCFGDGSYVELLAFKGVPPASHRWTQYVGFWGPIDFAVTTPNIESSVADLQSLRVPFSDSKDGGRQRPDGVQLKWRGAYPLDASAGLPFLIQDLTARELRVPSGDNSVLHDNAASGIAQVRVDVTNLAATQPSFTALFGEPDEDPRALIYRLHGSQVRVTQPAAGSAEATFIQQRGAGPIAVTIAALNPVVIKPTALPAS
jgi:hypothetical protein